MSKVPTKRKPKPPTVLRIEQTRWGEGQWYRLYFHNYHMKKLPKWVAGMAKFYGNGDRHVWINVQGRDELEAIIRFHEFWTSLPKNK